MTKNPQKKSIFKKISKKFQKKIMSAQGFEPWKHYALELEPSPFDHSGTLTKKIFTPQGIEPRPVR